MKQPFEPKHLRRYLLLYGGVVAAMLLFYLLTKLFYTPQTHTAKQFETNTTTDTDEMNHSDSAMSKPDSSIRLLPKAY